MPDDPIDDRHRTYPKEDCYETLGVDPEASQDVISATFRKLAGIYHSDRLKSEGATPSDISAAQKQLQKLSEAYTCVKTPAERKKYDEWRRLHRQPPKPCVSPQVLDFGTLSIGDLRTERLTVENDGGPVIKEINFSLANDPSCFVPAVVDATSGFPIFVDVSIDTSQFSVDQVVRDSFIVTLDGVSAEVSLLARVEAEIVTAPSVGSGGSPPPPVATYTPPPSAGAPLPAVPVAGWKMSRGWAIVLGWVAGFVFLKVLGPIIAAIMEALLPHPPNGFGWLGLLWIVSCSILFGVITTSLLTGKKRRAAVAALLATLATIVSAIILGMASGSKPPLRLSKASLPIEDKLIGSTIGSPTGIRWTHAIGERGAVFSAADSSRIEYPGLIPSEGTLEFWIKVDGGYQYANYQFKTNQDEAMIFSSDVQGGDVTWPGTTKIFVTRDGGLSIWMAAVKGENHVPATDVRKTNFRFGEWHAVGVSYGSQGQYIMLDGKLVASSPSRTQTFGQAGNQQSPLDVPTIGETVSHFWDHHRYEGGFEGVLAGFRVSAIQRDWQLAQGIRNDLAIDNLAGQAGDASEHAIEGVWQGTFTDRGAIKNFDMNLSQSGTQVTGSIRESQGAFQESQADVTGTFDGKSIQFIKKYRSNGAQFSYSGAVAADNGHMSGSWSGGGASGNWQTARTAPAGQDQPKSAVVEEPKAVASPDSSSPAISVGDLNVHGTTGADVWVDGIAKGQTDQQGNLEIPGLSTGSHQVVAKKSGFMDFNSTSTIAPGKTSSLDIQMQWAGGYLTVNVDAPGTEVDVSTLGHFNNGLSDLPCMPGTYVVSSSRPGFRPENRTVTVAAGTHIVLDIRLTPETGNARDAAALQLLEQVQNAMGGTGNLAIVKDWQRRAKEIWTVNGGTTDVTTRYVAPSSIREDSSGGNKTANYSNGVDGWTWSSSTHRTSALPRATVTGMVFRNLIPLVLCDKDPHCSAHLAAPETIVFSDEHHDVAKLSLNMNTHLPEKLTWTNLDGAILEETYSDWRRVGGVMWWFHMTRARDGNIFLQEQVRDYVINRGILDQSLSSNP